MMYVMKLAAIIKSTELVMDSEFIIMDDGCYADKPTDYLQHVMFLNVLETLKTGFENEKYAIRLVPVRVFDPNLYCLLPDMDREKKRGYTSKAKSIMEVLEKFGKKLDIEIRDPVELSEFQKRLFKS